MKAPLSIHSQRLSNPDLTLYRIGEESVVYARASQCLYGLDGFATAVLLAMEQGGPAALAPLRDAPEFAAVAGALATLLAGAAADDAAGVYGAIRNELPPPADTSRDGFAVTLMGTRFLLRLPDPAIAERVLPWLRHLADDGGPAAIVVEITGREGGYRLAFNGAPHPLSDAAPLPAERLFPLLLDRMRSLAYQGTDYLLSVHGAVVTKGRQGVLLPGQSGAGKSTLTAVLVANGYKLLTDEAAVLARDGCRALPVPVPVGLKAGSWPVAEALFPGFAAQAVHERWDGLALRYLLPPASARAETACAISHVVFPRFAAGADLAVTALTPVAALRRMTEAGYQVKEYLDAAKVEQLLDWLSRVRCTALEYGSTEDALRGIAACLSEETAAV